MLESKLITGRREHLDSKVSARDDYHEEYEDHRLLSNWYLGAAAFAFGVTAIEAITGSGHDALIEATMAVQTGLGSTALTLSVINTGRASHASRQEAALTQVITQHELESGIEFESSRRQ